MTYAGKPGGSRPLAYHELQVYQRRAVVCQKQRLIDVQRMTKIHLSWPVVVLYPRLDGVQGQSGTRHRDWSIGAKMQPWYFWTLGGDVLRRIQHGAHSESDRTSYMARCDFVVD